MAAMPAVTQHAVFTDQRHNIRHGSQCNQITVFPKYRLLIPPNRRRHLKGHTNASQVLEGVLESCRWGIDHRHGLRQLRFAFVVIRYN